MTEMGYTRDWLQCKQKIKNLKNEYKKIKDSNKQTGKGCKEWKHFELLDKILDSRNVVNAVQPPCILESMQNSDSDANAGMENVTLDDLTQVGDVTQIENSLIDEDNDLTQADDSLTQVVT